MNDGSKRKRSRAGNHSVAERKEPSRPQLAKWCRTTTTLDLAGNALRKKQPPRENVSVPGVDDDFDILVQEVALDDLNSHSNAKRAKKSALFRASARSTAFPIDPRDEDSLVDVLVPFADEPLLAKRFHHHPADGELALRCVSKVGVR